MSERKHKHRRAPRESKPATLETWLASGVLAIGLIATVSVSLVQRRTPEESFQATYSAFGTRTAAKVIQTRVAPEYEAFAKSISISIKKSALLIQNTLPGSDGEYYSGSAGLFALSEADSSAGNWCLATALHVVDVNSNQLVLANPENNQSQKVQVLGMRVTADQQEAGRNDMPVVIAVQAPPETSQRLDKQPLVFNPESTVFESGIHFQGWSFQNVEGVIVSHAIEGNTTSGKKLEIKDRYLYQGTDITNVFGASGTLLSTQEEDSVQPIGIIVGEDPTRVMPVTSQELVDMCAAAAQGP